MPDLLLINPMLGFGRRNMWGTIGEPGFPIGLGALAGWLSRTGASVAVVDAHRLGLTASRLASALPDSPPRLVGITGYTPGFHEAEAVARLCRLRYPGSLIVAGGPHASFLAGEVLDGGAFDCVVRGEGEETLAALAAGNDRAEIAGLSWRDRNGIRHNPDRPPLRDLDRLPLPGYDLIDPRRYGVTLGRTRRFPAASILTSRGCPYACSFCQAGQSGRPFRMRGATRVMEEIRLLADRFGIREFAFQDDLLTAHRGRLTELCRLLAESGLDPSWSCLSRVDTVDRETLSMMRRAGCHQVGFGAESGDPAILASTGKRITLDQVRATVSAAREIGLETVVYFILGLPGDTEETIQRTIAFSRELPADYCMFNIAVPLPGTRMYDQARGEGRLASLDWRRYNAADPVLILPGVPAERVAALYRRAFRSFYLRPRTLLKAVSRLAGPAGLRTAARAAGRMIGRRRRTQ